MAAFSNFSVSVQALKGYGYSTIHMEPVDYDADGWLDLLITAQQFPLQDVALPIHILRNERNGQFNLLPAGWASGTTPAMVTPREIIRADFNGDGISDVFIAAHGYDVNPWPGETNLLLLGKPGGGFLDASDRLPAYTDFTHSVDVADIDGDGDVDIFVGNMPADDAINQYLLINDGSAHFTVDQSGLPDSLAHPFENKITSLFIDADGDGDQDLYLGAEFAFDSWILLNDGTGKFSKSPIALPPGIYGAGDSMPVESLVHDFNGDGIPDILTLSVPRVPLYAGTAIQVLIGDGHGAFADQTSSYIDAQPTIDDYWFQFAHFVDLNGDGAEDLLLEAVEQPAEVYINDGSGRFMKLPHGFGDIRGTLEVLDVDHDGRMDIVSVTNDPPNGREPPGRQEADRYITVHLQQNAAAGSLTGDANDNTILGSVTDQVLSGLGGRDFLFGSAGKDTLRGGAGKDTLIGGLGSDTADYSEKTVKVSITLADDAPATSIVAGVTEDKLISIENAWGGRAADTLVGNAQDNTFRGGAGKDKIDGKLGVDTADYSDMRASVSLKLGGSAFITVSVGGKAEDKIRSVENVIGGTSNDQLAGDGEANLLAGGKGRDTLAGGAGSDRLDGGKDGDQFNFSAKLNVAGVDTIVKFEHDKDKVALDDKVFKAIGSSLSAGEFYAKAGATTAKDKDDHVIYNKTTGDLYYDKDGKGGAVAVHFATLLNHPGSFDHGDFVIV